jgi:hypothetical protein
VGLVLNAVNLATRTQVDRHHPIPGLDELGRDLPILPAAPAGLMKEQNQGRRLVLGCIDIGSTLNAAGRGEVHALEAVIRS